MEPDVLAHFFSEGVEYAEEYTEGLYVMDCLAEAGDDSLWLIVSDHTLEGDLAEMEGRVIVDLSRPAEVEVAGEQALVEDLSSVHYVECPEYGEEEGLMVFLMYDRVETDGVDDAEEPYVLLAENVVTYVKDEYGCGGR